MSEWPFDLWLKYAVKVLGLSPSEFWDMSVRDWLALTAVSSQGLPRGDFETLMQTYPDEKTND